MRVRLRAPRATPLILAFVLTLVGSATISVASHAQPDGAASAVALDWTAPAECPTIDDVEAEMGRLLAGAPSSPTPQLHAHAVVRREHDGAWRVELTTEAGADVGHRTLDAESCRAAADATALILALAVDPERVASNQASSTPRAAPKPVVAPPPASVAPTPPVLPVAPSEPRPTPRPPPPPAPTPTAPSTIELGLSGALDVGTVPTAAPGGVLTAALVPGIARWLRFEVSAGVFAPSSTTAPQARSGEFRLRAFDVGACVLPVEGELELGLCLDGEITWVLGTGLDESITESGNAVWGVVRPHATLAYLLSAHFAFRADLGVGLALDRPEFTAAGVAGGTIHQTSEATGRASLGVEVRF